MQLVEPSLQYETSWLAAMQEFDAANEPATWNRPSKPYNIERYLSKLQKRALLVGSPEKAPATTYWLVNNGEYVGHVQVQHYLTEKTSQRGGHIGYAIRPSKRGAGYGKTLLQLALQKAKQNHHLQKVLLTCLESNMGSRRIIENNGGVLEKQEQHHNETVCYYWITL